MIIDFKDMDIRQKLFFKDNTLNRFRKMTFASAKGSEFDTVKLSPVESSTLIVLFDIGETSMSRLAKFCGFTNSRITRAMDTLVNAGFAIRYFKSDNRRTVYATVTKKGMELVSKNNLTLFNRFDELISGIPQDKLKELNKHYDAIIEIYDDYCGLFRGAPYAVPQPPKEFLPLLPNMPDDSM